MGLTVADAQDENKPIRVELETVDGRPVPVFRLGGRRTLVGRNFLSAIIEGREYQGIIEQGGTAGGDDGGDGGDGGGDGGDGGRGGLALAGIIPLDERRGGLRFRLTFQPAGAGGRHLEAHAEVQGPAAGEPVDLFFQAGFDVDDAGEPRWLIPGLFYKHNRPASCVRRYPRFAAGADAAGSVPGDDFVSNAWAFRADRTALPFVFCWTDGQMSAVGTEERFVLESVRGGNVCDQSGVYFAVREGGPRLGVRFPYGEGPVKHVYFEPEGPRPVSRTIAVGPGDRVSFRFYVAAGPRDLHGYNEIIRHFYARNRRDVSPSPWVPKALAEELLAYGQFHWFYDAENAVLFETSPFDNYFSHYKAQVDRPHMHVAWVSGAAYAYVLLKHGDLFGHPEYREAGERVLDKIATGLAPCGAFWAEWTVEKGWSSGWNPDPHWIQARTVAEATYFLLMAAEYENSRRPARIHRDWERAIKSNLDFAVGRQRADGNLGSYYDVESGQVEEWDGAAGLMWIPALVAGASFFGDRRYLEAAKRAGRYYARFLEDEYVYGAPEDVHLTPTSEDGYNALLAYVSLGEADGFGPWLAYARRAADWMLSFRWTYNTVFPENTILGQYRFQTFGGDVASPANHHLHNYGLVAHPALLRLWEVTGDDYYLERAIDHLLWSHQFIAREDGDFNARKGMMTEQWFHTDWTHPKGSVLQLAHVWPAGWVMYADQFTREFGDIVVDLGARRAWALEAVTVAAEFGGGAEAFLHVRNPWTTELNLTVRVYAGATPAGLVYLDNAAPAENREKAARPEAGGGLAQSGGPALFRITVPAGGEWSGRLVAGDWTGGLVDGAAGN